MSSKRIAGDTYAVLWVAAYDKWCESDAIEDAEQLAQVAIAGGLPYYDTTAEGTVDLGSAGWRAWLQEQRAAADNERLMTDSKRTGEDDLSSERPAYVPAPLPWE